MNAEIHDRLKPERVQDRLQDVPEWQVATTTESLEWTQTFEDLDGIIGILVEIAMLVGRFGRAPNFSVQGNELTVRLGMDGLTEADFDLAAAISNSC